MGKRERLKKKLKRYAARRRVTIPGAPPGTVTAAPAGLPAQLRVFVYGPEAVVEREIASVAEISELLAANTVIWVNVIGLGSPAVIEELGRMFGLHKLALEDVVHLDQRPKVEAYAEHLFVVVRMPVLRERLTTEQFSLFLGKNFVVTFDERPGDCLDLVRERLRNGRGKLRETGADHLAYAIVDAIIDAYFPVIETYGERLEGIEDVALGALDRSTPRRLLQVRQDLAVFRRAIWPLRETLSVLYRDDSSLITPDTRVYLRDCYDHCVQLLDILESYREVANGLMDLYMSGVSNRMNEVMKVLTMISTIFIPLSFIAGVYGMNFDVERSPLNMPELRWYYGYPVTLAVMAVTALLLVVYFYRKGWLSRDSRE